MNLKQKKNAQQFLDYSIAVRFCLFGLFLLILVNYIAMFHNPTNPCMQSYVTTVRRLFAKVLNPDIFNVYWRRKQDDDSKISGLRIFSNSSQDSDEKANI